MRDIPLRSSRLLFGLLLLISIVAFAIANTSAAPSANCTGVPNWDPANSNYTPPAKVVHNGSLWLNASLWWLTEEPGTGTSWKNEGTCSTDPTDPGSGVACEGNKWSDTKANYNAGDTVFHGDLASATLDNPVQANYYTAKFWTAQEPGTGGDWTVGGSCMYTPPPPPPASAGKHIYYFPEWGVYGRNFQVGDIQPLVQAGYVDTIQYSFIEIEATGSCKVNDPFVGLEWTKGTNGYEQKGTLAQMAALRDDYIGSLKIILSLGGWTLSDHFSPIAADPAKRATLVSSCVAMMTQYGFDGIDVDWEFPGGGGRFDNLNAPNHETADGPNFVLLLQELRAALDAAGTDSNGDPYLLTIAVNAGEDKINRLPIADVAGVVDYIQLMTYDLNGGWSTMPAHNAPLYANPNDPRVINDEAYVKNYNSASALQQFIDGGAPPSKLVLGLAFYGRSWVGVPADSGFDPLLPGLFGTGNNGTLSEESGYWCHCEPDYDLVPEPMRNDDGGGLTSDNNNQAAGPSADGLGGGSWEEAVYDYDDIQFVLLEKGWTRYWDEYSMSPFAYNPNYPPNSPGSWVSYDDVESIAAKTKFAADHCLGGIMVWEFTGNSENTDLYGAVRDGMGMSTLGLASTDPACPTSINQGGTPTCESMGVDTAGIPVYPEWPKLDGTVGYALGGDMIKHNGFVWQAAWWTSAEPGTAPEMCTGEYDPTIDPATDEPIGCSVAASDAPYCSYEVVAPNITLPNQTSTVGTPVSVTPTNTGDPATFTATGLPAGLSINPNTGEITGTPTTAGSGNATITATNAGGSSSITVSWTVAPAAATNTPVPPTNTPTRTPVVVPTNTPMVPTNTPMVPTNTPMVPTNTPMVPTDTPMVPTNTPMVPTNTPMVPTNTPVPNDLPTSVTMVNNQSNNGLGLWLIGVVTIGLAISLVSIFRRQQR